MFRNSANLPRGDVCEYTFREILEKVAIGDVKYFIFFFADPTGHVVKRSMYKPGEISQQEICSEVDELNRKYGGGIDVIELTSQVAALGNLAVFDRGPTIEGWDNPWVVEE
jgi:hypothetical protein